MLWLVCMDVGYTVVMSVGRVSSVKVRFEKNGMGETAQRFEQRFSSTTKHGCELEYIATLWIRRQPVHPATVDGLI